VDFPGHPLNLFAFVKLRQDFLPVGLVHQCNLFVRHPFPVGAALKGAGALINER
jgi:hypothetical protein